MTGVAGWRGIAAEAVPLRFQIGARTLWSVPRRLHRVALPLDDAIAARVPRLPALGGGEDGILVTSLAETRTADLGATGLLVHVRQRYRRCYVDLTIGADAWWRGLSANARSALRRKEKRLAGATVTPFRTADEIAAFHPLARAVSRVTYQERLLDAGLPADPAPLVALAAADRMRAWLLSVEGRAVAYLCCTGDGRTLRYDHVGHDPALAVLAPGTVLQAAALRDLFAEGRWARFDFLEGEGQHKRQFATEGVACVDLLLLRTTVANRLALAALRGWDRAVAWGKRMAPALRRWGR